MPCGRPPGRLESAPDHRRHLTAFAATVAIATTVAAAETTLATATVAGRLGEWQRVGVAQVGTVEVRLVFVVLVVIVEITVVATVCALGVLVAVAVAATLFRPLVLGWLGLLLRLPPRLGAVAAFFSTL
jgi:ABC-type multidrug transport system permease subunit